jgi:hypothetical protein
VTRHIDDLGDRQLDPPLAAHVDLRSHLVFGHAAVAGGMRPVAADNRGELRSR